MRHFVVLTGCSGGGKSTLTVELERRGHSVVHEPGRRIIAEERQSDGGALPWDNPTAFARRALSMSISDHDDAVGLTFFDRGVVDAAVAIMAATGESADAELARYRYDMVILAPPWPEIYVNDQDRRHSLETALRDYERVQQAYLDAGYNPVLLPRDTPPHRVDFVLRELGL